MLVSSQGMLKISGLSSFVGEPVVYYLSPQNLTSSQKQAQKIAGWGRKKSFFTAKHYAEKRNLDLVCLEDGFIRSLGLGKEGFPPLSLVVDQSGIYFDATQPSDLEYLIGQNEDSSTYQRAEQLIQTILTSQITKYNQQYQPLDLQKFQYTKNILVVDQTYGDQSIRYAGASVKSFKIMLHEAIRQHPDAIIWLKTHPDVIAGKAKGHFDLTQINNVENLRLCTQNYNPIALLQQMDEVYVVSSQMGFEALLCDKKVHCFGMPWYAGWGLTDDSNAPTEIIAGRRMLKRSLQHLFSCAYLQYARYISPVTQQRCELEDILALLQVNIRQQQYFSEKMTAYGFSRWKRSFMRQYLSFANTTLKFQSLAKPAKNAYIIAWGKKARLLKSLNYPKVCTVEDGFIRSSGLGANLVRPYSLVFDPLGIYYDATQPSQLEEILNTIQLNLQQKQRVEHLIEMLKKLAITKYNVGEQQPLQRVSQKKVILVTGQVQDDLSVQLGGVGIKTNLALLQKVRTLNPEAYIIYKPHPDVHAGLRLGQIHEDVVYQYADELQLEASVLECFAISDEVHTISSLSGFEALLRGLSVHCYGLPFYAGWGLTTDIYHCGRRKRHLSLTELVYGVLIDYASYNLPQTEAYGVSRVNVEDVLQQLAKEKALGVSSPILKSLFATIRAKIVNYVKL